MSGRKRFFLLLGILTAVAIGAGTITLKVLYDTAFEEQRERLIETAENQARLIEAVARFDENYSRDDFLGGAFEATFSQLREAHSQFKGFGKTGEFTLAKLEGDSIIFLLTHRHHDLGNPHPVPFAGLEAEPMQLALSGHCGAVVGLDYRGEMVLAAYEPVAVLNLGVVAKIDLAEIRAPFIRAGVLAGCVAAVLVILGAIIFFRIGMPLVNSLEESEMKYRQLFASVPDAVFIVDSETSRFLDVNQAALELYGYDREEFLNLDIQDINAEPELSLATVRRVRDGDNERIRFRLHKKKDGTVFPVEGSPGSFTLGGRVIICDVVRDITERIQGEEMMQSLVKSTVGIVGTECFETIASELCRCLGADVAVVGELVDGHLYDGVRVRCLAMIADGKMVPEFEYSIEDTPCETVAKKGFCVYSSNVCELFPLDNDLIKMNAEGYVGTAIRNKEGVTVGVLCAIFRNEVKVQKNWEAVMEILASRAAADIDRLRAESALRESEEKHRILVEQMNEGLCSLDADGCISFANDTLCKMLGRSLDDIIGLTPADMVDDLNRCIVDEEIRAIRKAAVSQLEIQWSKPDGQPVSTIVSATALRSPDGAYQGAIVVITDISARMESETALKESETKYRAIIDNAVDAIVLIDVETGRFMQYNSEACEILGYSPDEFQELTIADIDAAESPDEVARHIETVLSAGSDKFETQMRTKSGELKDVLVSVTSISLQGRRYLSSMWHDVTTQKQAEIARRQQHEFLQNVIDSLSHPLYVIDPADYTIKLANAACKMRGYEDGMTCHRLFHEISIPCNGITQPCPVKQVLATGKPATVEHQHVDRKGQSKCSQINAFPVFDQNDNIEGIIVYVVDISERKIAEVALTNSLKEKETLLKEIHHRVKNNLQIVSSLLRIQSDHTENREAIAVLEASQARVNSMALIHEQLYQTTNLAQINFTEYVQTLTERLLESYGVNRDRITVKNTLVDVFLSIDTAIPCGLIITELLSNALKHAFPDGRTGRISISYSSYDNQSTLTISDTGVGVSGEVDLKRSHSLGLQLVSLLARQLGGSIEMKVDQGTSFSLRFPREATSADDSLRQAVAPESVS